MESVNVNGNLMNFFNVMVTQTEAAFLKFGREYDARSLEEFVESQVKALGGVMLETFWRAHAQRKQTPQSLPCPCGRVQHYVSERPRALSTTLGKIDLAERHYFHCDQCGAATYTNDDLRGTGSYSRLAEERIALVGKEVSFQKAADLLKALGTLELNATTVRDTCNRVGEKVRADYDRDAARQHTPQAPACEEHCPRLAVAIDGVMLGRIDPQHRRRKSARGKVRGKKKLQHFFHEVKTLVVFDFDRQGEAQRKTYYATQDRVEDFREKVASEASKRGADQAELLAFLGDGAPWIWKTAEALFPQAVQVLDWYHAVEHLWSVGRAHFGPREAELHGWIEVQKAHLWDGRLDSLLRALEAVALKQGTPDPKLSEEARASNAAWIAQRSVHYFSQNRERMKYPEYRAKGLPLGSGVVESGCKHLVADRLKRTGMRWDQDGAENVLSLRYHHLNQRWDSTWAA